VSPFSVLFIGGTGNISSACAEVAVARGIDLTLLNRGQSQLRGIPDGARSLTADIRDMAAVRAVLAGREYDAVVDFIAYNPEHVDTDIELVSGRTGQYVFISSASAYAKPVAMLPIRESTPLRNPESAYSRAKIACEERLATEYRERAFPVTVVRPSHTYDRTAIPLLGGWTVIDRMRRGEAVVVHGDGTSLWVLTHHADFASAFVSLLGRPQAVGDTFHITGDEAQPWDQIYRTLGRAAGVEPELVHVSSEQIARTVPDWGPALLGDAAHSVIFDNTKLRQLVPGWHATIPWAQGAREIIEWFDAESARRIVDPVAEANFKSLIALTR
jgi:nucleoside-diphosphate-sugar epimerase